MPRTGAAFVVLAVSFVLGAGAPALAQESEHAEELIRQANDLRRQGQDSSAIPLLRQAYKISRSPRTAAQLGLAEFALGYWVEAEQHLAESLAGSGNPWVERNRKVLETSLGTTRAHVANLTIEGEPAGAQVHVNGRLVGTLPLPGPTKVGEGSITLDVEAPNHKAESRAVTVAGKASQRLWFRLAPADVVAPPPPPVVAAPAPAAQPVPTVVEAAPVKQTEPAPTWRRALPWALGAGALVAAGVGVWQHVVWQQKVGDFDAIDACGRNKDMRGGGPCQGLYDAYTGARTRAFIGYGAAAALGVGAAAVFIVDAGQGSERALVPGPGTFGVAYAGRF